jgi:hypothetical protein
MVRLDSEAWCPSSVIACGALLPLSLSFAGGRKLYMCVSEMISKLDGSADRGIVMQMDAIIPTSVFGLFMTGLPKTKPGERLVVGGSGSVTSQFVTDINGKTMIKACADPELFDVNYPGCINVTMNGRELLEMAEKIQNADGVLICSAASFHSYPIYKASYATLLGRKPTTKVRQWWQFWKFD